MGIQSKLKNWWNGKYIPPENEPGSGVIFMMGSYKHHWSSKAAHVLADFWLKYWQWTIGIMVALFLGLYKH